MQTSTRSVIDITMVMIVSLVAYAAEGLADAQGWIPWGEEARGAPAVVAGALAALCVALARGGTLSDLGFKRPKRWILVPLQAAAILVAFATLQALALWLVSRVVPTAEMDVSRYQGIAGNLGGAIAMALILPLTAAIPEEIIYRGFLIGRLSDLFGRDPRGAIASVLVQALLFGSVHFMWGFGGMIVAFVMGMIWGTAYLLCDRNLWVVILAHSGGHILLVVGLYLQDPAAF